MKLIFKRYTIRPLLFNPIYPNITLNHRLFQKKLNRALVVKRHRARIFWRGRKEYRPLTIMRTHGQLIIAAFARLAPFDTSYEMMLITS